MKLSYKNTAISFLENPKDFAMHTPQAYSQPMTRADDLKLMHSLIGQFSEPGFADYFNKKIQYVTQPFHEAYRKAHKKLKEVVLKTPFDDSGTLIFQWPNHIQTLFYRIKSSGNGSMEDLNCFMVMFTKTPKNDSYGLDLCISLSKDEKRFMDIVWKGFVDEGRDMSWWIADLMLFKTFLKYAEVETKIVNAEKKEHHVGVKYVNETKKNIEILDSTYFTTISRTEGFGVSGHFRFQPCGPGMKCRRFIWISDYEKKGYTKRAKIERIDNP